MHKFATKQPKCAQMGQNRPIFCILYAKRYASLKYDDDEIMHDVSILHLIVKMVSSRRMKLLQLPVQCECVFWCRGCVSLSKRKLTSWRRLFRWILVWSKGAIITKQRKSLKNIEHVFGYYWSGETPFLLAQVKYLSSIAFVYQLFRDGCTPSYKRNYTMLALSWTSKCLFYIF